MALPRYPEVSNGSLLPLLIAHEPHPSGSIVETTIMLETTWQEKKKKEGHTYVSAYKGRSLCSLHNLGLRCPR